MATSTLKFPVGGRSQPMALSAAEATTVQQPAAVQQTLVAHLEHWTGEDGRHSSPWPGLSFYRTSEVWVPQPVVYTPCLCVVAQGRKKAYLGERIYVYDPLNYLVLSVPLPVKAGVIEASPEKPFLSLMLELDLAMVRGLLLDIADPQPPPAARAAARAQTGRERPARGVPGIYVSQMNSSLIDAVIRLLRTLDHPQDLRVLGPMVTREILYHVLAAEQGHLVRSAAVADSGSHRIARVIRFLQGHYDEPLDVPTIARSAGMSTSSLHHTFKEVTSLSPLQYLKQIRLHQARLLMLNEGTNAGEAAHRVGYASPSHFSREFKRLFGATPTREVELFRQSQAEAP